MKQATEGEIAGVFESFRVRRTSNGMTIVGFEHHLTRLKSACSEIGVSCPLHWFQEVFLPTLKHQALAITGDIRCRVLVSADGPEYQILPWQERLPAAGVRALTVYSERILPHLKQKKQDISIAANRVAEAQGAHEAILTSPVGLVREGAWSNVVWRRGDEWISPRTGFLYGVTLKLFSEYVGSLLSVDAYETDLLTTADEMYLLNATHAAVPVGWWNERVFSITGEQRAVCNAFRFWCESHASNLYLKESSLYGSQYTGDRE